MTRFMNGEIDAVTAVAQMHALPVHGHQEAVRWPEGTFSHEHVKKKFAEIQALLDTDADPAA